MLDMPSARFIRSRRWLRNSWARIREPGNVPDLAHLALRATVVGAVTGFAAASFRLLLNGASQLRDDLIIWGHHHWWGYPVVVVACGAATAAAASLVHRVEPHAEGSGIPRVEAVIEGRTEPGSFWILPVKYIGGLLSMGAGLALGREGPSVQMGGNAAIIVARLTRSSREHLQILVAGGAAAGLATAFSAPIAGGVFVLEELVKRFEPRTTLATLIATGSGFASAHLLLGEAGSELETIEFQAPQLGQSGWVVLVGLICGVLGVGYNALVMGGLHVADTSRIPVEVRAVVIGVGIGSVAWFAPWLVGSGGNLTQSALLGQGTIGIVLGVLVVRVVLGVVSYAALTPGGLFAPMLGLGSHLGLAVGIVADQLDSHAPEAAGLALIGMAAFFTASVRAPVTGIVLASEMTSSTTLLAPTLGACAVAMLVAMALRSEPIYDLLTTRAVRNAKANRLESE
jgi:CIC family chloride channel protein